jgi:putative ABC transport system ATP-binding protein
MVDKTIYALNNVSLEVKRGEMLAIMGSSGSGKSTLLHILGAIDSPDAGKIYLNHILEKNYCKEPRSTEIRSEYIGFIYQNFNLLNDFTVEENIALPLILANEKGKNIREQVAEKIKMMGLVGREHHRPGELSGGQQQRVAIARALITNPKILLADEPTGNLDYNTSVEIIELLKENNQKTGQTTVIVTHDPMVAGYADRILFVNDGSIREEYISDGEKNCLDVILEKFKSMIA